MRSDPVLKKHYNLINKKFFLNGLPSNVCVRYVDEHDDDDDRGCAEKYYGWTETVTDERHKYVIVISRIKNPGLIARLSTLIHEMCHIATELRDDHGEAFSRWHELLTERGIFRKHAVLKGRTLF